jgi:hypothetical protein
MFSKTNVTLENCTQELASTFATMPALEGERSLRPSRIAYLDGCRKAGTFAAPTWAVVIDKITGVKYRANGRHSSTMLSNCPPEEYPAGLLVTIEEYTTDDLTHDAFLIFDLFDNPRSVRTNTDVMGLHRAHYPELKTVDDTLCVALCNGIAMFEAGREKGIVLVSRQRGGYLQHENYRSFIVWAATALAGTKHDRLLKKPGVVAEMIANRGSEPSAADEFWRLVFTESHPDADHETRELSRTLLEWARKKPMVGQDRFRRESSKQWRRFRRNAMTPQIPYEQSPQQDSASA